MSTEAAIYKKQTAKSGFAKQVREYFWGVAFLVPAIVTFVLFLWTPIIKGIVYSFMEVDFVKGNRFIGLDNYRQIFASSLVGTAVLNTLLYMLMCVVIGYAIPSFVAIAISELRRFQGVMRLFVYLPNIVPAVVLYGMWQYIYDPLGPANQILSWFHAHPVMWLTDKSVAMLSIVLVETWQGFGATALIYLAGVVGIPKDLYEAAEIDGAGVYRRIRHITIPGIRHLYVLMLIMQIISTSQSFQTHYAMTGGGPNNTTLTYMYMLTNEAFVRFNFGGASAMGVLMFSVLTLLSVLVFIIQGRVKPS